MNASCLTFKIEATGECLTLSADADDKWVVAYITPVGIVYQQQFPTNYVEAFRFYATVLKRILTTLDTYKYITELFS